MEKPDLTTPEGIAALESLVVGLQGVIGAAKNFAMFTQNFETLQESMKKLSASAPKVE
jgi:hypothetical protein